MKITYTPNPLNTIVELDEHEQRELWYKIKVEDMVNSLFAVHYELKCKKEAPDMERIAREVDPDYYLSDDERDPIDLHADEMLAHYVAELQSNHVGDCTCVPCSCSKCHAEEAIGIQTTKGLGKYSGHQIQGAFNRGRDPNDENKWLPERSLAEALEYLRDYNPKPAPGSGWDKVGGFEAHIPRWKAEAKAAYDWLLAYHDQHFSQE